MADEKEKTMKIKVGGKDICARGYGTLTKKKTFTVTVAIAEFFIKRGEADKA